MAELSIIVPVYKVEAYLIQCLDSIIAQSFTDWELILVDDGTPDKSGQLCDEYAQADKRVRVFHKPNGGVSSARNKGLDEAKGKWVTFIDADDFIGPNFFEGLLKPTREYDDLDFVQAGCTNWANGSVTGINQQYEDYVGVNPAKVFNEFRGLTVSKLFRLENVNQWINGHPLRFDEKMNIGEDMVFTLDFLARVKKYAFVSEIGYYYRRDNNSSLTKRKATIDFDSKIYDWKHMYSGVSRMMIMHNFDSDEVTFRLNIAFGVLLSDVLSLCRAKCSYYKKKKLLDMYTQAEMKGLFFCRLSLLENQLVKALEKRNYALGIAIAHIVPFEFSLYQIKRYIKRTVI